MPANNVVNVSEIDFDTLKDSLKAFLSNQDDFTDYDFEGSAMATLIDVLAYNTHMISYYTNVVGNEMFLDSAQLRNSVVSRAKSLGYTPVSSRGASANINVTIVPSDSPASITIPRATTWTSTIDSSTYNFITPQEYVITPDADGVYQDVITIKQGLAMNHRWTVSAVTNQRYVIPNPSIDTTSFIVNVQAGASNSSVTSFKLADDINDVMGNTASYFLFENEDGKYELQFGDGNIGKALTPGNIVVLDYCIVAGTDTNGANNFIDPSDLGGYSNFLTSVVVAATRGSNAETIDSIKFNAPKHYAAQNRAVVADDYKRIILRDNPDIQSLNIWGGQDNVPPQYGKVFISAKPASSSVLSPDRKADILNQLVKYNTMAVTPEFVDATYLYVVPTITTRYDKIATSLSATAIADKVSAAVINYETTKLGVFGTKFRYSQFLRAIDDTDNSVVGSLVSIKMQKRFVPNTATATTYTLVYNNSFDHPHAGHADVLSSSSFTYAGRTGCFLDDNGYGIVSIYYIDTNLNRSYVNTDVGTINYATGTIVLNSLLITAYAGNELAVNGAPEKNDVFSTTNQVVLIADASIKIVDDASDVLETQVNTVTTSGETTTTLSTGVTSVIY